MIAWVDSMLHGWAYWALKRETRGIGYPTTSPMFRDSPSSQVFESKIPLGLGASDYRDVNRVILTLPEVPRAVLVCHYQRAHSLRTTAEMCGISTNTASKYINDAHETIAARMSNAPIVHEAPQDLSA